MWIRQVFLGTVLVVTLAGLGFAWLRPQPVETPRSFDPQRYSRPDYAEVLADVNRQWETHWRKTGVAPAPDAASLTICRRLALALTGTIPSLEEIRQLQAVDPDQRVDWYVSRLLEDRRTADYLAERLARSYVGTENGPFLVYRRRRFVSWLSDRLIQNQPYDQLVRDLISDTGLWTDSPAVNFVTVTLDQNNDNQPDPIRLAARTTRAFLGLRLDCLQCHDDHLGTVTLGSQEQPQEGRQLDFHRVAAFFGEVRSSPLGVRDSNSTPYSFQLLHETEARPIDPTVPFAAELLPPASGQTQRARLAAWVTHPQNRAFARATINRVWGLLCGKPLVQPIDQIPLWGEFPPGLERLAQDWVDHQFDLHRLIRLIAASRPFQLDSRTDSGVTDEQEANWAAFPLSRLRPEQVAGGLIQATSLTTIDADSHVLWQLRRFGEQTDFVQRFGDSTEEEFSQPTGTVTQRLLMMNGQLVKERTKDDLVNNAATQIALLASTDEQAIEIAYLSILSRQPTRDERDHFLARFAESPHRDHKRLLEDLYWVLLNGTEFCWNH
jgi:hypothetical protein